MRREKSRIPAGRRGAILRHSRMARKGYAQAPREWCYATVAILYIGRLTSRRLVGAPMGRPCTTYLATVAPGERQTRMKLLSYLNEHARVAGYHGDSRTFLRLLVEERINDQTMHEAWDQGQRLRVAGARCDCRDCGEAGR